MKNNKIGLAVSPYRLVSLSLAIGALLVSCRSMRSPTAPIGGICGIGYLRGHVDGQDSRSDAPPNSTAAGRGMSAIPPRTRPRFEIVVILKCNSGRAGELLTRAVAKYFRDFVLPQYRRRSNLKKLLWASGRVALPRSRGVFSEFPNRPITGIVVI